MLSTPSTLHNIVFAHHTTHAQIGNSTPCALYSKVCNVQRVYCQMCTRNTGCFGSPLPCQMRGWYAYMLHGSHTTPGDQFTHVSHDHICMDESQADKCFHNHTTAIEGVLDHHYQMRGLYVYMVQGSHTSPGNQFPHVSHVHIYMDECLATSHKLPSAFITTPKPLKVFWITIARYLGGMPVWSKAHKPHPVTNFHMFSMSIYV